MNSSKQMKIGAVFSYFTILFNIVAGLIYTPWMISRIGQSNYGLFTLASSLITLFVMDFGMSAAVTRFVSKYNTLKDQASVNNFLGIVYKLYLTIDAVIMVVLIAVYFFIDDIYANLNASELLLFKDIYIIVALFSVISFPFVNLNGILTSYEKFVPLKACDLFNKCFTIVAMVIALVMGYGVYALVTVNALAGLITIAIKLLVIKASTPVKVNFRFFDKGMLKDIFGFSLWTTVGSVSQRLIFNIIPSILGVLSGSVEIAIFGIAHTVEGYIYTFSEALNGMFLPRITRIVHGENKDEKLLDLMINIGRLQSVIVGALIVGFITLGKDFIVNVWVGADYEKSYWCAILLIIHYIVMVPQQIANTTIVVQNKVKYRSLIFAAMAVMNVIIASLLAKKIGALGASVSVFVVNVFCVIALNFVYVKVLNIDIKLFFKNVYPRQCIVYVVSAFFGFALVHFNVISNKTIAFLINGALFVVTYIIMEYLVGLKSHERKRMNNKIKEMLHRR